MHHLLYCYLSSNLPYRHAWEMRKFRDKHSSSEVQSHPLLERHYTTHLFRSLAILVRTRTIPFRLLISFGSGCPFYSLSTNECQLGLLLSLLEIEKLARSHTSLTATPSVRIYLTTCYLASISVVDGMSRRIRHSRNSQGIDMHSLVGENRPLFIRGAHS